MKRAAAAPDERRWRGRRVLVTGHTGFVGGWLCAWLQRLGASVHGFALAPATTPSFFTMTDIGSRIAASTIGDVRDAAALTRALEAARPHVVFHLAAQALVRAAHADPVATFATNVMGTVNLLEACRGRPDLESVVIYTTDKVYRNDQSGRAFGEADALGGNEPYSASKAGADWAAGAWWDTYFRRESGRPAMAIVRAGNIIGGGDWAADRLLPDAVRAFAASRPVTVRSPGSTRPWQHVLDAVRGTLLLAETDAQAPDAPAEAIAWNLGPGAGEVHPVSTVVDLAARAWGEGASWRHEADPRVPESRALVLSSEKARARLGWRCAWDLERSVRASVEWYRTAKGADPLALTQAQIDAHVADALVPA